MIPDSFIQELLARIDIVTVVERYVTLRKSGANYSACCPFHTEKTPSFTVSPAKQFYHCFGCGAHGSAIGFLMQYSGLGFVEAVEELAASVGLPVPRQARNPAAAAAQEKKAPLTEPMARALKFYREQLKTTPKAIDYLRARGLTGEIAARFGLGYAPDDWQGLRQAFADYDDALLVECGLVIVNEQGRRYDRFRDRVMFPILDQRGNVIGFGGRVIGQGEPKYLNSPETPLFEKGRELYGLPQARKAIQETGIVLVVEGYMDVVGLAQHGVENVVATLGTAATDANMQKLLRLASRVVFCFDRDNAGDQAARRAMEASLPHLADNKTVDILQMPGDQDPDEFIRHHGKDAFMRHMHGATRLSEFMVRELAKQGSPATPEGRAKLVHLAKPLLQKIAAPLLRVQITKEIASLAQLTRAEVEAQCELKPLIRHHPLAREQHRSVPPSIEQRLLEVILRKPVWAIRLPLDAIAREQPVGALLHAIADAIKHGELSGDEVSAALLEHFRGTAHELLVSRMTLTDTDALDETTLESVFNDAIIVLRKARLTNEIRQLTTRESQKLSPEETQRLSELLSMKRQLEITAPDAII